MQEGYEMFDEEMKGVLPTLPLTLAKVSIRTIYDQYFQSFAFKPSILRPQERRMSLTKRAACFYLS